MKKSETQSYSLPKTEMWQVSRMHIIVYMIIIVLLVINWWNQFPPLNRKDVIRYCQPQCSKTARFAIQFTHMKYIK